MAEKIKKRRLLEPCPAYDVERIESWLQDMAREGWVLEGQSAYWLGFFTFVKAEPQEIRYRLEPKKERHSNFTNAPDEEEEYLYKEYGWEFVTQFHYFYIYRTADPNARELNTDYAVQATALKQIKRTTISALINQLVIAIWWIPRWINEAYRMLVSFDWSVFPAFCLMVITAVTIAIKDFFHIRKLRKQLNNNIPLDHNKPWRKHANRKRAGKIAVVLLYAYVIIALLVSCTGTMSRSYEHTPVEEFPGDPPFVTCADMGEFTKSKFLDGYNAYNQYSTMFGPTIIEWKEYGTLLTEDGIPFYGGIQIDYYETRSPWLARGLVDNFLYEHEKHKGFQIVTPPDIDVDYVICYDYLNPVVLIQHENIFIRAIVSLEYQDENAVEEWALLMAARLTQ